MIRQGWCINLDRSTDRRVRMEAECARRAPGFRNSGFSLRREWRYAASFGGVNFARLLLAQIKMRWAGVKLDIEGKYILPTQPGLARS